MSVTGLGNFRSAAPIVSRMSSASTISPMVRRFAVPQLTVLS
jgi:hypothetical protein